MGSTQSVQLADDEEEEEVDDEAEDEEDDDDRRGEPEVKKVLQQEPEMLPCYASASPLSPHGTPRLGASIKVWDPYNVLAPPPALLPHRFSRNYSFDAEPEAEVYLICHGESELSLRPEVVAGRCPSSGLTGNGNRQARALAVFLNSQGVRFNSVYTSPLDRARATAISVCQEMSFSEQQIQISDALTEVSQGHWEGCLQSEIYTPEMLGFIERHQPDFSAPSGESLRQVEFRMAQFLNETLLGGKLKSGLLSPSHQNEGQAFSQCNGGPSSFPPPPHWDSLNRHRQLSRKKSGKSRLQVVTTTADSNHYPEDEISPQACNERSGNSSYCVGVFTHSVPIKCILTGILGCSPVMSHKICIDDSSVTVLQHSYKTGWQVKRLNDTAHLRLL